MFAICPNTRYLYNIKNITRKKPIKRANKPALIESWPKSGPTVLSSIMFNGAGNAPDLNNKARSVADWKVKLPLIWPLPPKIASLITGALIISPSKIMANLLPKLLVVIFPNFFAPTLSSVKFTTDWFNVFSNAGLAFSRLSPLITTLLFTLIFLFSSG